jgi:hypothetical protein
MLTRKPIAVLSALFAACTVLSAGQQAAPPAQQNENKAVVM